MNWGIRIEKVVEARLASTRAVEALRLAKDSSALQEIADAFEQKVVKLVLLYNAQPDCPFGYYLRPGVRKPCGGKMLRTPTSGRLECEKCRAIALIGGPGTIKVHV